MANSDGQRIRRIGLRQLRKMQNGFDHLLHLTFFSASVSDDGLFYLERGVFENGNMATCRGQYCNPPYMTLLNQAFYILPIEDVFYGDDVRRYPPDNLQQLIIYGDQTGRERTLPGRPDFPSYNFNKIISSLFNRAVAGNATAGVNTQDSQFYRSRKKSIIGSIFPLYHQLCQSWHKHSAHHHYLPFFPEVLASAQPSLLPASP